MICIEKYNKSSFLDSARKSKDYKFDKYNQNAEYIYYIGEKKSYTEDSISKITIQLFELIDVLKNHYCRIEQIRSNSSFHVIVCQRREHQFGDIIIDTDLPSYEKQDFLNYSFNIFINNAIANVITSLSYNIEAQLLALKFLIGAFTCDQIFYKDEEDMKAEWFKSSIRNENGNVPPNLLLGLYIVHSSKIGKIDSKKNVYSREIWLCKPLIDSTYNEVFKKNYDDIIYIETKHKITNWDFFNMVLFHELGHAAFNNSLFKNKIKTKDAEEEELERDTIEKSEKRANYYASYISMSRLDIIISIYTELLPKEYHNPLLLSMKYCNCECDIDKKLNKERDYVCSEKCLLGKGC